jgi:hypothetical protein
LVETGDDVEMVMQVVDDDEERMMELLKLFPATV